MSDDYGPDFITVTDDDGNDYELEHLGTMDYKEKTYMAFLPADMDEDDEDYGIIILEVGEEDGEEILMDIEDDDLLDEIYEQFISELFEDEDEEDEDFFEEDD